MAEVNIHGTAIVVGTQGLIFVGPAGSGKSTLAFTCLAAARRLGLFSALVADDQTMVSVRNGQVLARPPATIAGLIELRGSGIVTVETLAPAVLHYAVLPVDLAEAERLPPEAEDLELTPEAILPLIRLSGRAPDPLAMLAAFIPFNGKAPS